MAEFVTAIVSAIAASVGGTAGAFLIMNAGAVAAGSLLVGGLAMTSSQRKKAKQKAREAYNSAQVDRLVNVQTSIAPRELVLGRVRKGGHVFFRGSVGAYKEKFVMLIGLASHEIDGIEQIYFNDVPVTLDVDGYVQTAPYLLTRTALGALWGTLTAPPEAIPGTIVAASADDGDSVTYQYSVSTPKARVRVFSGADSQAASADVIADFPALWTADHRARGVAYLHCEFWYDETAYPSGLPAVTALMRGAKIYDPRSGLTVWTENPSLMQRHVLLHPQFGKRTSLTAAEDARIIAAANACDASHDYGDGAVALYRAGLVVPYGAAPRDVLDDLALAMGGSWAYAAGEFYCKAGVYTAPVMSLGEQDLVRYIESSGGGREEVPMVVATHRSRNEKINVLTPRIYDAAQDYKQAALAPLKVSSYIARDGAELAEEVDMQAVGYAKQAHHIAGIMLRDARDPLTFSATFKLKTWPLELFDTVSLTIPLYGWSGKIFEIRSRSYAPGQGVRLLLKETAAAITQPDASFPAQGFAVNTSLPKPWDIAPPAITGIFSGDAELTTLGDGTIAPRVRVVWSAILDQSISQSGQVEIEWQEAGSSVKHVVRVSGSLTEAFLDNVPEGKTIIIRARTRNAIAVSDFSLQQAHLVIGKTAPPPAPAFVSLTQTTVFAQEVTVLDLAGYRLRSIVGSVAATSSDFARGSSMHEGLVTDFPWTIQQALYGVQTVMVVAVDDSGNESEPAYASLDFGQPDSGSVGQSYEQGAAGWLGDKLRCAVDVGALKADADPVSDLFAVAEMFGESDLFSSFWLDMVYTAEPFTPIYGGGTLVLDLDAVGDNVLVEFRKLASGVEDLFASADLFASPDLLGLPSAWAQWPGALRIRRHEVIQLRVSIAAGGLRGQINSMVLRLALQRGTQDFSPRAFGSGGLRLAPADGQPSRVWAEIRTVGILPKVDGSGAVSGRWFDLDEQLGPLVELVNASGVAVNGTATATVGGLIDEDV